MPLDSDHHCPYALHHAANSCHCTFPGLRRSCSLASHSFDSSPGAASPALPSPGHLPVLRHLRSHRCFRTSLRDRLLRLGSRSAEDRRSRMPAALGRQPCGARIRSLHNPAATPHTSRSCVFPCPVRLPRCAEGSRDAFASRYSILACSIDSDRERDRHRPYHSPPRG